MARYRIRWERRVMQSYQAYQEVEADSKAEAREIADHSRMEKGEDAWELTGWEAWDNLYGVPTYEYDMREVEEIAE